LRQLSVDKRYQKWQHMAISDAHNTAVKATSKCGGDAWVFKELQTGSSTNEVSTVLVLITKPDHQRKADPRWESNYQRKWRIK
jgi:hypothetical protein